MVQAFFSLYCLVKNTLPSKVFFKCFKVQILFFFLKKFLDFEEDGSQNAKICVGNRDVLAMQYQQEMEPPMRHYIICK